MENQDTEDRKDMNGEFEFPTMEKSLKRNTELIKASVTALIELEQTASRE